MNLNSCRIFKNRAAFALFRAPAGARLFASDRPAFAAVLAALALTIAAALTGCTKKQPPQQEPVKEGLEEQKAMTDAEGVDIDFSTMNANMVYAPRFLK